MDRKDFIRTCGVACWGGMALATLLESCASASYYAKYEFLNSQIVLKKSEFIKANKEQVINRNHVLLKSEKYSYPICLYKLSEDKYSALLMECTHRSCELQVQGNHLLCPCHGSEFTNTGVVQNPPAEIDLHSFQIRTDEENIYITI